MSTLCFFVLSRTHNLLQQADITYTHAHILPTFNPLPMELHDI